MDLHRLRQRRLVVAGVIERSDHGLVREGPHEILLAQVRRIEPKLARRDFDQPLDHEGRFGTSGAAIGIDRHRVGIDRIHLAIDRGDVVLPRQQRRIEIGRHRRREGRHIGAEIGDRLHRHADDLVVRVEAELGMGDVIAAMRVGDEGFRTVRGPFHRTRDLLRGPQAHDLFRIDEDLRAEAAADIRRDHPQLVLGRNPDKGRDHQPRHMRILAGGPEREMLPARIVFGDRRARLDRIRHQAIVDEVEPRDVLRGLHRGVIGRRIADMPVVDGVVRRDLVNLRRALPAPAPDRSPPAAPRNR